MFKKTINQIADLEKPVEFLAQAAEKISREKSITLVDARKFIAKNFGIPTWYQLERQLASSITQRKGGRWLFDHLKTINQCIKLSCYDRSKLSGHSKQLLAMSLTDCINLPATFQGHLLDIGLWDSFYDYLDGEDVNIHVAINHWAEYSNIRFRESLAAQLREFVRFKINTKSMFSTGDLLDKASSMHMYARCQPDGSRLTLSEFWCQKSQHSPLPDHENFIAQSFHVVENVVLEASNNLPINDVRLEFKSTDGERFYKNVFLKSKIKNLRHRKNVVKADPFSREVEMLFIQVFLSP